MTLQHFNKISWDYDDEKMGEYNVALVNKSTTEGGNHLDMTTTIWCPHRKIRKQFTFCDWDPLSKSKRLPELIEQLWGDNVCYNYEAFFDCRNCE